MEKLTFDEANHVYKFNGLTVPSVTQIIQDAGLVDLSWINKDLLEEKRDLGNKVHSTTELYDLNELEIEDLHPLLKGYLNSWIKFRKDYSFTPLHIEVMKYHALYKYAGRIDRVGFIGKELSILDIKSGTEQATNRVQTAGYKLLYDSDLPKAEQIKGRYIVYLNPEGYKLVKHLDINDQPTFLAALTISNFKRSIKK